MLASDVIDAYRRNTEKIKGAANRKMKKYSRVMARIDLDAIAYNTGASCIVILMQRQR